MTQLAPVHSETSIPLGRRIGEIMEEKGDAYSLRAFGRRIGMSKDVLHRCITGDRYIKPSELERVAQGLGTPLSRLLMDDVAAERSELKRLLKSMGNPPRALQLAKRVSDASLGCTEKGDALNDLGRAYFDLHRFDEAHEAWLAAYPHAALQQERYGETELLFHVVSNLFLSFHKRKDYTFITEIKDQALSMLGSHPKRSGCICYSLAKVAENLGNLAEARSYFYQSVEFFRLDQDARALASAKHALAAFEFRMGKMKASKEFFEEALQLLEENSYERMMCLKEYSKTLIKRGQREEAVVHLKDALRQLDACRIDTPDTYRAKLHILLSRATNDPQFAIHAAYQEKSGTTLRMLACKFLIHHYERNNDSEKLLVFQKLLRELSETQYDVLYEEDV